MGQPTVIPVTEFFWFAFIRGTRLVSSGNWGIGSWLVIQWVLEIGRESVIEQSLYDRGKHRYGEN
jgi:hypothetical protein